MDLEVAIEDIPLTNARNFLEEVSMWTFSKLSIHDTMFEPFIFNNLGSLALFKVICKVQDRVLAPA